MKELIALRWTKAKRYADAAEVHLIFVVLGKLWAQDALRTAFTDVPGNSAIVITILAQHAMSYGKHQKLRRIDHENKRHSDVGVE